MVTWTSLKKVQIQIDYVMIERNWKKLVKNAYFSADYGSDHNLLSMDEHMRFTMEKKKTSVTRWDTQKMDKTKFRLENQNRFAGLETVQERTKAEKLWAWTKKKTHQVMNKYCPRKRRRRTLCILKTTLHLIDEGKRRKIMMKIVAQTTERYQEECKEGQEILHQ